MKKYPLEKVAKISHKILLGVLDFSVIKYIKNISIFFSVTEVIHVDFVFTIFTIFPITIPRIGNTGKTMLFATVSISTALTFLGDVTKTSNKTRNIVGCQIQIRHNWTIISVRQLPSPIQRIQLYAHQIFPFNTGKWNRIE